MTRVVSLTPIAVGRDSRTYKQAASMARLGYTSTVVEGEPSDVDRERLPFELSSPEGGARERGPRRTARRMPPASLYYLHSPIQYPSVWLRTRRSGAPYIYDAHDFYPAARHEVPRANRLGLRLQLALERRCVAGAARVVTVSDGVAELIDGEFGVRPVVIRNSHDSRLDEPRGEDIRSALGLSADDFLVVMAGNAKRGRAIAEAIDAMTRTPDSVHLAFVGGGFDEHVEAIGARSLSDRVHLLEPVAPTRVVPFIATADAAIILYFPLTIDHLHALPNGFFQAVAAGLPLLYPGALPEMAALCERYGLGVAIDPERPDSIAAGIETLAGDPALAARYSEAAKAARHDLSWEAEEKRLSELVRSVLDAESA